jgi:N-acetylglucosaminyl-diphospho-decaprenol L-rhamnosyltransferase
MTAKVSVVVVSYNTANLLMESLSALHQSLVGITHEVVVIDNASRDGSAELIAKEFPDSHLIINPVNVGFGRANNQALSVVQGRYVLLLNTDAIVSSDTLTKTVSYMDAHDDCGILGVKIVDRDGTIQPSARYFPTPWGLFAKRTGLDRILPKSRLADDMTWDRTSTQQCDWVPGCYCLIRREVIDQVGLFDPRYFLYYEEVDHCFAAKKAGWDVMCYPDTTVMHIGGESAKSDGKITDSGRQLEAPQIESQLLYFRKHYGRVAVVADVLLTSLADAIIVAKRLVKGRKPFGLYGAWRHTALVWALFRRTRGGMQPTR